MNTTHPAPTKTQLDRLFAAGQTKIGGELLELVSLASLGSARASAQVAKALSESAELRKIAG